MKGQTMDTNLKGTEILQKFMRKFNDILCTFRALKYIVNCNF